MSKKREYAPELKTKFFIKSREHVTVIDEGEDSDDRWRYRGATELEVDLLGICRDEPLTHDYGEIWQPYWADKWEDIPKGSPAYIVAVTYVDGDTFGSHGEWGILALCSDLDEATKICHEGSKSSGDKEDYLYPWQGYFARYRSIDLVALTMM